MVPFATLSLYDPSVWCKIFSHLQQLSEISIPNIFACPVQRCADIIALAIFCKEIVGNSRSNCWEMNLGKKTKIRGLCKA